MITTDPEILSDLAALREVVRDFLSGVDPHGGIDLVARVDRDLWTKACTGLGMAGVDVPEDHDGAGLGAAGLAVVAEEAGRTLARLPLLGSVVVAQGILLAAGGAVRDAWLPRLLAGEVVAAVADRAEGPVRAVQDDGGWRMDGTLWPVQDGLSADVLLVAAETGAGLSSFLVEAGTTAVHRSACRTLDLTRDAARVELRGAPAVLVGEQGAWGTHRDAVAPRLDLAVAAASLGSAETCLASAVEYAGTRVQFGRAIGSFQAIKHRLAELAVLVDDARSAVEHAAWCADARPDDAALSAAVAAAAATEAHLQATADVVQVHGGIGFTWEHPDHLHLRRAQADALLFGDVPQRREAVLRLMGL
ncbi:hypothetical protein ASE01_15390 [Nocardioides sp. Root190]|uniref:acyl-CoA dehydrogenase family protein n=1 Tax=Nocardioides sp. Root190 TaxID=1736488 RepID=UPI0006FE944F|nr:acyl-CoA dehydrogenase family protein [Nocardioides sp. Root190]KRB76371.1 hypothetical protein ASE01_15390 [Nocardioides sp. Root190]